MEKIEIGYRHIGTVSGVEYHHKFIIYTDKNGNSHTISGWTDDSNQDPNLPFGNIRIIANTPYDENNPDSYARNPGQKQYRELIVEAPDLSEKWMEMISNARSKDNIYPYDYLRQNSNTLADTVLREAKLPEPRLDGFSGYLAPGSGKQMDRNLVPKSPNNRSISDFKDLSYLEDHNPLQEQGLHAQSPATEAPTSKTFKAPDWDNMPAGDLYAAILAGDSNMRDALSQSFAASAEGQQMKAEGEALFAQQLEQQVQQQSAPKILI